MTSISLSDLFTIIFVLVDDWYQIHGIKMLKGKHGVKPEFSDSEVITLLLAMDFIPYPSESQFLAFIRANYLDLFPKLVDQSQFNRRARSLRLLVEELRRHWLIQLGIFHRYRFLIDTKPVPVVGYKRSKKRSYFAGNANYGYCASKDMHYFGYKLVVLTTCQGIPVIYDLVPANLDERSAAETVIDYLHGCHIFGEKGFLGKEWQASIFQQTANQLWTPKRSNQYEQNPADLDRWINGLRERIEGVFHEIQNTGRNIERLLAKTVLGLCTRIIAKMTSHVLKYLLRHKFGVNVQAFQWA
jgi:hypothetical protein